MTQGTCMECTLYICDICPRMGWGVFLNSGLSKHRWVFNHSMYSWWGGTHVLLGSFLGKVLQKWSWQNSISNPIRSMRLAYLPAITMKITQHVGKYTSRAWILWDQTPPGPDVRIVRRCVQPLGVNASWVYDSVSPKRQKIHSLKTHEYFLKIDGWKMIHFLSKWPLLRKDSRKVSGGWHYSELFFCYDLDVSKNSGTPKSSILIGFSIINHPF